MKLPKLKQIDIKKLTYSQKESDWQKSVLLVLVIALVTLIGIIAYTMFRPLGKDLKSQLENQVNSDPVKIDTKTLNVLNEKGYPN